MWVLLAACPHETVSPQVTPAGLGHQGLLLESLTAVGLGL